MTYADLPRLLTMTLVWLLLLTWQLNAYRSNCVATLALVILVTLLLFVSGAELALYRRRVFLNECMEHKSSLFRWLRRRYVLLGLELLKSAGLAVLLLVSVLSFSPRHWSLLFADVLLVGLLLPRFYGALKGQLREEYRFTTARRSAMWVSTLFLWLESMLVLVFTVAQDYDGLRWQEVITYGATDPDVLCRPLASLAALAAAVDALGQWSIQNLARSLTDLPQALMASISLLVGVGLSLLLSYAYSRALIGAVARPWTMWRLNSRTDD
ncbi:hypothetical protein [Candidatus Thiodictyon syntrophicum]|uniref:Uncharacterized protein n=1 Tax=Candidatus Thiodictyon syntrophicum TaxID=1166950 RepID=A0A2K8UCS3_9GAMM|nr:hypothetical protein [Candidatus Thiodictyon syntrophicum]AUB83366.1 hypothetical protein THSYN_22090 [Candidatus Thiodictyon syntrophicum]